MVRGIVGSDTPGLDGLIEDGKNKAYLAGMQFAASLPLNLVEDLQAECDDLVQQIRDIDEEEMNE